LGNENNIVCDVNAPTKLSPIKHPTPAYVNATNKPLMYKQKRIGLKTPPCATPLTARK